MGQFQYVDYKIYDNIHKGKRGFVIGGGHSIRDLLNDGFNFGLLENDICIGVNKAYELLDLDYFLFTDAYFWDNFKDEIKNLNCIKFAPNDIAQARCIGEAGSSDKFQIVKRAPGSYGASVMAPNTFNGEVSFWNNSGVSALRIAHILGLNPIYLVGIDLTMKNDNDDTHFHNAYSANRVGKVGDSRYHVFYSAFEQTIKPLQEQGVKIFSCSAVSKLNNLIPFIDINTIFEKGNI